MIKYGIQVIYQSRWEGFWEDIEPFITQLKYIDSVQNNLTRDNIVRKS